MSNEEPNEKPSHSEGWKILVIFILVGPLVRVRRKILGNHVRQLPHPADMNCKAFFRIELATALAPGMRVSSVLLADIAMLHQLLSLHFSSVKYAPNVLRISDSGMVSFSICLFLFQLNAG